MNYFRVAIAIPLCIMLSVNYAAADISRDLAKQAYHQIEGNVFDISEINSALQKLRMASEENKQEPWIYITASLAELVYGYKIGDWYRTKSFKEGSVEKALMLAERAKDLGPGESQVYAHLARIHIIKREYRTAWELLNTSYKIDPNNFYAWYYKGIVAEKSKDVSRASGYFDEALEHIDYSYQKKLVNIHQQKVARLRSDITEQENLLKENITNFPNDAHIHGNYAAFLMRQKRYSEAVEYWEMAVERGSYREAEEQLAKAKRLEKESGPD